MLRINSHSPDELTISPRMQAKQVTSAECLLYFVSVHSPNVSLHYIFRGKISDYERDVQTDYCRLEEAYLSF